MVQIPYLQFFISVVLMLALEVAGMPTCCDDNIGSVSTGKAIYFLTNDVKNAVVALPIGDDGTLSQGTITRTGGMGSVAVDGDGHPATPDALVSQSSLTVVGDYIFAVNAGSNTLSMLAISDSDPTQLHMVGKPVAVPGEFPSTVAASSKHNLVCVGTTGAAAGISCGGFSEMGISPMDSLRPFNLGQTTPPVGPTNTVSQVLFSDDESLLLTMVKGDPAVNKTGFVSVFPVQKTTCFSGDAVMSLAEQSFQSSPEGTAVLFGSQVIPGTANVFATDASFGAAIISVDPNTGKSTTIAKQRIDDQAATCWSTISTLTNTAFITDVGANRLIEMSLEDASIVSTLDLSSNGDPGLIDLRAAGNYVYALSPGNGTTEAAITVVEVSSGSNPARAMQHFELQGLAGKNAQGMAVLV